MTLPSPQHNQRDIIPQRETKAKQCENSSKSRPQKRRAKSSKGFFLYDLQENNEISQMTSGIQRSQII